LEIRSRSSKASEDVFGEDDCFSAGPIRFVALVFPYAEALGNLYSVKSPCEDLSTRPFFQRPRRAVSREVLWIGVKAKSFDCSI
jgi:hypothetical protein